MVERQEVDALLEYVEMRLQSDKVELPPTVSDDTLAALCRAWLAMDAGAPAIMDRREALSVCAPTEADFSALYALQGQRVRIVKEVEEIPRPGTQQMFSEVWSDPEFVAQVEAEKAETQAAIERHSREADK